MKLTVERLDDAWMTLFDLGEVLRPEISSLHRLKEYWKVKEARAVVRRYQLSIAKAEHDQQNAGVQP